MKENRDFLMMRVPPLFTALRLMLPGVFGRPLILLVLSPLLLSPAAWGAASITYSLGMSRPSTHLFEVEVRLEGLSRTDSVLDLVLPVWRTGRYTIMDFAGGIERFSAVDGEGRALPWMKTDKATWHIRPGGAASVAAHYLVYANEFSLRTRGLNDEHGFVDGTAVFMMAAQYRNTPLTVVVRPYGQWHVTTGLEALPGRSSVFQASGYDELADCPMEIGMQRDYEFTVRGVPHVISLAGQTNCRTDSTIAWTRQIVEMNAAYWGGLPYKRFLFLYHFTPEPGGGTEHMNSCVLDVQGSVSRTPEPCRQLIGLISHEFFHTWNVKRLRPKAMDPYDFTRENYSRELWLAEGGTSYMHNLLLVRARMTDAGVFLRSIPGQVASDRQRPGNREQSVTECSFDNWVKFWRSLPEAYNFESDLYGKGAAASFALDMELRHRSENRNSLDSLFHVLLRRCPLERGGYAMEDLEQAAVDLAGDGMRDFFARYIYHAEPIPWETLLEYAGLRLRPVPGSQGAWLGLRAVEEGGKSVVRTVVLGSPAYEAGLDLGDQLLALDGVRVGGPELAARIAEYSPGDTIRLSVFHRDQLRTYMLTLGRNPVPSYSLTRLEKPDQLQKSIYESWLGRRWEDHD